MLFMPMLTSQNSFYEHTAKVKFERPRVYPRIPLEGPKGLIQDQKSSGKLPPGWALALLLPRVAYSGPSLR